MHKTSANATAGILYTQPQVRIFLAASVWEHDRATFMANYERFLALCDESRLSALVTIFDRDFPNCQCGIPSGSATCSGGCATPSALFITSGAHKTGLV